MYFREVLWGGRIFSASKNSLNFLDTGNQTKKGCVKGPIGAFLCDLTAQLHNGTLFWLR